MKAHPAEMPARTAADGKAFAGGGKFLGCGNPEVCHAHLLHVGDLGDGEVDGVGIEVASGASLSARV